MDHIAAPNPAFNNTRPDASSSHAPYRIYNIGNNQPVELMHFIETIEQALGQTARKNFLPMQAGDVLATYADVDDLRRDLGFQPTTPLSEGIAQWVTWFRDYSHRVKNQFTLHR